MVPQTSKVDVSSKACVLKVFVCCLSCAETLAPRIQFHRPRLFSWTNPPSKNPGTIPPVYTNRQWLLHGFLGAGISQPSTVITSIEKVTNMTPPEGTRSLRVPKPRGQIGKPWHSRFWPITAYPLKKWDTSSFRGLWRVWVEHVG